MARVLKHTKGLMKEFRFPNNVKYEILFCPGDVKHCVSGSKNSGGQCVKNLRI